MNYMAVPIAESRKWFSKDKMFASDENLWNKHLLSNDKDGRNLFFQNAFILKRQPLQRKTLTVFIKHKKIVDAKTDFVCVQSQ